MTKETRTTILRETPYPVADTAALFKKTADPWSCAAYWTGEHRPVRPGEWYLSGAIVGAYFSQHGTADAYHIAKIYRREIIRGMEIL